MIRLPTANKADALVSMRYKMVLLGRSTVDRGARCSSKPSALAVVNNPTNEATFCIGPRVYAATSASGTRGPLLVNHGAAAVGCWSGGALATDERRVRTCGEGDLQTVGVRRRPVGGLKAA